VLNSTLDIPRSPAKATPAIGTSPDDGEGIFYLLCPLLLIGKFVVVVVVVVVVNVAIPTTNVAAIKIATNTRFGFVVVVLFIISEYC
jgi:hypothetical protein